MTDLGFRPCGSLAREYYQIQYGSTSTYSVVDEKKLREEDNLLDLAVYHGGISSDNRML